MWQAHAMIDESVLHDGRRNIAPAQILRIVCTRMPRLTVPAKAYHTVPYHTTPDGRLPAGLDLLRDPLRQHVRHRLCEDVPDVVVTGFKQGHVHLLRAHLMKG